MSPDALCETIATADAMNILTTKTNLLGTTLVLWIAGRIYVLPRLRGAAPEHAVHPGR